MEALLKEYNKLVEELTSSIKIDNELQTMKTAIQTTAGPSGLPPPADYNDATINASAAAATNTTTMAAPPMSSTPVSIHDFAVLSFVPTGELPPDYGTASSSSSSSLGGRSSSPAATR